MQEITTLYEEFAVHNQNGDMEGAEEILAQMLQAAPQMSAHIHFEYGRLYARWNKLSSALKHLTLAAENANTSKDLMLLMQVTAELKSVKELQSLQKP